ncbi:uncharacterized protein BJ171DRAFT_175046 [Polychytrium aggregatum]|uniref:uncharacterized protein n=1 Tax=Polychytrium aggregatum TaxID=110093 RepID=UPI0022FF0C94|nr:uncharacterized protein BJ171DRAFT_175046 [Polychytrium aggregatum]KAI9209083.1 hypothetical protein BJ171DRAFT_175046 [Polychytrium aggregatum]
MPWNCAIARLSDRRFPPRGLSLDPGFVLYALSQVFGSVIALGFLTPAILAPLSSAGLIFNVIFSSVFLGTTISVLDWCGTLLIIGGCCVITVFGSKMPDERQTIEDLIRLYTRTPFVIYILIQILLLVLLFLALRYIEWSALHGDSAGRTPRPSTIQRRGSTVSRATSVASTTSRRFSTTPDHEKTPLLPDSTSRRRRSRTGKDYGWWLAVVYASMGGTIAAQTLLLTKSGVELLITSILDTNNQFHGIFAFGLLALLLSTIFCQLYCLNRGLHFSLPVIVVPMFFTFFTIFSFTNSLVYLDQFGSYRWWDLVIVSAGMGILVFGVYLLTLNTNPNDGSNAFEGPDGSLPAGTPPSYSAASSPTFPSMRRDLSEASLATQSSTATGGGGGNGSHRKRWASPFWKHRPHIMASKDPNVLLEEAERIVAGSSASVISNEI